VKVDLDELEQIARSEHASVVVDMIAELRAAREVVEAARISSGAYATGVAAALHAYDQAVGA
jgi:hypothetical protein